MEELERAEKLAWHFYKLWRKHDTYCPSIKRQVLKSLRGWWHIKANRAINKRPTADLIHRYSLLPLAEEVLKNGKLAEKRTQHNQTFYAVDHNINELHVRVVVVEDKKKNVWFLSITEKTKKTAPLTLPKY